MRALRALIRRLKPARDWAVVLEGDEHRLEFDTCPESRLTRADFVILRGLTHQEAIAYRERMTADSQVRDRLGRRVVDEQSVAFRRRLASVEPRP